MGLYKVSKSRRELYGNTLRYVADYRCEACSKIVTRNISNANRDKSCGCMKAALISEIVTTHGMRGSPTYRAWCGMKTRCGNPNRQDYFTYGGRGITICDRWLHSFENFLADMGHKPTPKHSIDRIDPNGNYEPLNCRWATSKSQNRNTRSNKIVTINGESKCVAEWSEVEGAGTASNIYSRLALGWPHAEAVFGRGAK